jgi:hypothetical protein
MQKEEIISKKEHNKLLDKSRISIIIKSYDDIFSSFDPRPYSMRALSDDFLIEAKRAAIDKEFGSIELSFLVPQKLRNLEQEATIKKRLRAHFKHHEEMVSQEQSSLRKKGSFLVFIGVLLGFIATYVAIYEFNNLTFIKHLLLIFMEPASWFMIWNGFDEWMVNPKKLQPEKDFYEKMSFVTINFESY